MSRKNQRQLKYSRLKAFTVRNRTILTDSEGVTSETFPSSTAFSVRGEIWPATSKRQIEQYGSRIDGISNFRITGQYDLSIVEGFPCISLSDGRRISIGDGVYVLADPANDDPDYRVISITPYQPVKMEIERR